MWIVAIAWIYVVGLMSVTETSIVAGVMTFLFYCILPLSILYYLSGGKRRQAKRERAAAAGSTSDGTSAPATAKSGDKDSPDSASGDSDGGGDGGGD